MRRASDDAHAAWHLPEASAARGMRVETLFVLETNVDDLSPQIVAYALEEMLAAGALDAWSVAATMKKGRMGSLLCALCDRARVDTLCEILFQVRSSVGFRGHAARRGEPNEARLTAALPPKLARAQETSSLGIRVRACDRVSLDRSFVPVDPGVGKAGVTFDPVNVKVARLGGETINAHPEYDECAALARKTKTPLKTVFRRAVQAYFDENPAR